MEKILATLPWWWAIFPSLIIWFWKEHTKKQIQKELDENRSKLKKLEILDERTWKAKKELYDNFVHLWNNATTISQNELLKTVKKIQNDLPYYASDGVVQAYVDWRHNSKSEKSDKSYDVKLFANIMMEIRKDMGFPQTEVTVDNFLEIYISDYEK